MDKWENKPSGSILIVDDSRSNLSFLSSILENAGYEVYCCINGASGLANVRCKQPNLVLLDVDMPEMDGFEICNELKKEESTKNIPVIFISAMDEMEDKIRGFESGGVDYITKPFQIEEVLARVKTHLTIYNLQKEIEEAGHRNWQATFNAVKEAIFLTDTEGNIIDTNQTAVKLVGSAEGVAPQGYIGDYFFEKSNKVVDIFNLNGEIQFPRLTGWFEISTYPLTQKGLPGGTIFVIADITEKKQFEAQMISSQRLADLGGLSAAISHELKSPLQVISWASETLLDRYKRGILQEEISRVSLVTIQESSQRINDIVYSLLNYARSQSSGDKAQDINEIVQDTLRLIEHQLKVWANIKLSVQLGNDLPKLVCDRLKISQVLINLLINARDAMPSGGSIIVCTQFNSEKNTIELKVTDTGTGIPEAIQKKIFDQFFTTKPLGQGTGLGLYIVNSIVRSHGGQIHLESKLDEGTTFILDFPVKI